MFIAACVLEQQHWEFLFDDSALHKLRREPKTKVSKLKSKVMESDVLTFFSED